MIRTSTVVYVIILLGLVGAYFFLKNRPQSADIELTAEAGTEVPVEYLFRAEQETPSSIRIESRGGEIVEVARDAGNAWVVKKPIEAGAQQGAAEAAASQITAVRILDRIPNVDLKIMGLDSPQYMLTVKFTDGAEQSVDVGVMTPTESGYYVRDPDGNVIIVSRSAIDALLEMLRNPPYLETPTPSPIPPTATLKPPAGATATPQP